MLESTKTRMWPLPSFTITHSKKIYKKQQHIMSININVKELKNILDSIPPTHNIMLSGKHEIIEIEIYSVNSIIIKSK